MYECCLKGRSSASCLRSMCDLIQLLVCWAICILLARPCLPRRKGHTIVTATCLAYQGGEWSPCLPGRCFSQNFLSLWVFVSWWYLSRVAAACNLVFFVTSSSTYRCIGVAAAISVRNDPSLSSSGVIASSPYNKRKGVNPVVLVRKMLWIQTELTSSWAHFPFAESKSAFDIAAKMRPFALSIAPLLLGWLTEANASLIPSLLQKFLNSMQSNCFPLSTMM